MLVLVKELSGPYRCRGCLYRLPWGQTTTQVRKTNFMPKQQTSKQVRKIILTPKQQAGKHKRDRQEK